MNKTQNESDSKVFDFAKFKKKGGGSLHEKRDVDESPKEFREFPYKSEFESEDLLGEHVEKDDIIGDLLNEFSEDLKETNHHQDDKSLHFFELKNSEVLNEDDNFEEILDDIDTQIKQLQDNCSRVKFLISEIENQMQD